MNKKLILAASLLLACGSPLPLTSIEAQAQATQSQGTVTGTVTDETGEPVIGAAIENITYYSKISQRNQKKPKKIKKPQKNSIDC